MGAPETKRSCCAWPSRFNASEKFDDEGVLQDQDTKNIMKKQLQALVDWTRRIKQ